MFGEGNGGGLEGLPTGARTPAEVRENWDAIKREERRTAGGEEREGDAGSAMPALIYARQVQRRFPVIVGDVRVQPALEQQRQRRVTRVAQRPAQYLVIGAPKARTQLGRTLQQGSHRLGIRRERGTQQPIDRGQLGSRAARREQVQRNSVPGTRGPGVRSPLIAIARVNHRTLLR